MDFRNKIKQQYGSTHSDHMSMTFFFADMAMIYYDRKLPIITQRRSSERCQSRKGIAFISFIVKTLHIT